MKPVAPTTLALSNHFYILKVLYKPIEKKTGGKHIVGNLNPRYNIPNYSKS